MASFTLPNTPFPAGTSVSAYDAAGYASFPAGGPPGSPVATATVTGGSLEFTGLTNHHSYFAAAKVAEVWQSKRFSVGEDGPPPRIPDAIDYAGLEAGKVLAVNEDGDGYEFRDVVFITQAVGDGVTDDTDAWQAAIEEAEEVGGIVVADPTKTYLLDKAGTSALKLSRNNDDSRGRVIIDGRGATVKLSTNTPRFLDFDKIADGDTFQNIEVCNLTVDADEVGGRHHIVLGTYQDGAVQTRINLKRIKVRDVRVINAKVDKETGTNHRLNVHLAVNDSAKELTRYSIEDIYIEDLDLDGGNEGVFVGGGGIETTGLNVFLDEIHVARVKHDMGAAQTSNFSSAHVQVGSRATGGRATIADCWGSGSGDIGIEVDSMMEMTVARSRVVDPYGAAFYHTNFNYPTLSASAPTGVMVGQRVTFDTCKPERLESKTGRGFRTDYTLSVPLGKVILKNCGWHRKTKELAGGQGEAVLFKHTGKEARIEGFDCSVEGVEVAEGAAASAATLLSVEAGTLDLLRIKNLSMAFTGKNAAAESQTIRGLDIGGPDGALTASLEVDGVSWAPVLTTWVGGVYGMIVGNSGEATLRGSIRNLRLPLASGLTSASRGILFGPTSKLTVASNSALYVDDCDFGKMDAGESIGYEATSAIAKILYGPGMVYKTWPPTLTAAESITPKPGYNAVTGGTEIKKATALAPGTKIVLKFAESVKVKDGENLKLTADLEATADDTLSLVCDGTNWYETGRSAN